MCSEFKLIHELCLYVLSASQRQDLIRSTLSALHAYLSWIPLGYIFESPLVICLNQREIDVNTIMIFLISAPVAYSSRPSLNSFLYQHIGISRFNVLPRYFIIFVQLSYCQLTNWSRYLIFCCLNFFWQVAALNFGDFYNVQYVKMYTIFIGQLQVY